MIPGRSIQTPSVMPGLVPGIHAAARPAEAVEGDARNGSGHDDTGLPDSDPGFARHAFFQPAAEISRIMDGSRLKAGVTKEARSAVRPGRTPLA